MFRTQTSYTSAAANLSGYAANVTGPTWALSATTPGDSLGHQVTIQNNSATDHSAKTALITGTGADGAPLTETLALPAASATTTSTKFFRTVTSVVPSATIGADTMNIGWGLASQSAWTTFKDTRPFQVGFGVTVDSGSPTYTVQHSYGGTGVFNHPTVAAKTASAIGDYLYPVLATRLTFAAAGGATFYVMQSAA